MRPKKLQIFRNESICVVVLYLIAYPTELKVKF